LRPPTLTHIAFFRIMDDVKPSPIGSNRLHAEPSTDEHYAQAIVDMIPALAWSADADGSAEFVNQRWLDYTGLSVEQAIGWGWTAALHPSEIDTIVEQWRAIATNMLPAELECRLRRFDGMYRWFMVRATPSLDKAGRVVKWFGTCTDIEDRRRAELFLAGEKQVLEFVATGRPLPDVLVAFCNHVETIIPECHCSVMVLDSTGSAIEQMVAPSIPSTYCDGLPTNRRIDSEGGPCAMAAHRKTQVIVSNVETDMRWETSGWRSLALAHDLRSCWSTPILSSTEIALGSFAIYWRTTGIPTEEHKKIIAQFTHLIAVAIERKRSEEALREREERLRLIVDTIPGFISTWSADGRLETVNQRTLEYIGTTLDEVVFSGHGDFLHPDDRERMINAWSHSVETGEPFEVEGRSRRADGVYHWFHTRGLPLRDTQGRILRWYKLSTDITHLKETETALRESERRLRAMVDTIPGNITITDPAGEVEIATRRTLDDLGITLEELKHNSNRILHPDDLEMTIKKRQHSFETGEPYENQVRVRRPDGRYRWYFSRANPLRNAEGRIVQWYFLATDIDDQKRAEEALRKSQADLAHVTRVASMGQLTGSIAHEVNRPFAAVVTNGQACLRWLDREIPDLTEVRLAVKRIIDDGIRGSEVIERIRRQVKKEEPARCLLDVNEVVREISAMREIYVECPIPLMDLASSLPMVLADRVQLQQVLLNLIGNAADAMRPVTDRPRKLGIRTVLREPEVLVVAVQDTGVGVDPVDMDQLFETFYTTKPNGLGMGLSISRSIVESHGGQLWAEPNAGPGMTFYFTLPIQRGGGA
jgi:PAS domain S-box-containing protein